MGVEDRALVCFARTERGYRLLVADLRAPRLKPAEMLQDHTELDVTSLDALLKRWGDMDPIQQLQHREVSYGAAVLDYDDGRGALTELARLELVLEGQGLHCAKWADIPHGVRHPQDPRRFYRLLGCLPASLPGEDGIAVHIEYWPARLKQGAHCGPIASRICTALAPLVGGPRLYQGKRDLRVLSVGHGIGSSNKSMAIRRAAAPSQVSSRALSLTECIATVRAKVEKLLPNECAAEGRPARKEDEVARLVGQMRLVPASERRVSKILRAPTVSASDLASHIDGLQCAAWLVAENEVERRIAGSSADIDHLAAGLSCALFAVAQRTDARPPSVVARTISLIEEWVTRRRRGGVMHMRQALSDRVVKDDQYRELLVRAPWLHLVCQTSRPRVVLPTPDVVEVLMLGRPNEEVRYRGDGSTSRFNSYVTSEVDGPNSKLQRAYGFPPIVDIFLRSASPDALSAFLGALSSLPRHPQAALDLLGSLELPAELESLVRVAATTWLPEAVGDASDGVVFLDLPAKGDIGYAYVLNRSRSRRLIVRGHTEFQLSPVELSAPHASSYLSQAIQLSSDAPISIAVAGQIVPFVWTPRGEVEHSNANSEWVDDYFRGRELEVSRILQTVADSDGRQRPIAIFGPRRAGKTTLAIHAYVTAQRSGLIDSFQKVDLFAEADASNAEEYRTQICDRLAERFEIECGSTDDVVAVLRKADREAMAEGRRLGVLLDEFDTWLVQPPGSYLNSLATRVGALELKNICVVATMQRFHRHSTELKGWQMLHCDPELPWEAAVTYFFGALEAIRTGISSDSVQYLNSPVLHPSLTRRLVERVGMWPYFWGQVRQRLEAALLSHPNRLCSTTMDDVDRVIEDLLEEDTFLALPLQNVSGLERSEVLRRDLFSDAEKRVLLALSRTQAARLTTVEADLAGAPEAVGSLADRGLLRIERADGHAILTSPLFAEYIRRNRNEFLATFTDAPSPTAVGEVSHRSKREREREGADREASGQATELLARGAVSEQTAARATAARAVEPTHETTIPALTPVLREVVEALAADPVVRQLMQEEGLDISTLQSAYSLVAPGFDKSRGFTFLELCKSALAGSRFQMAHDRDTPTLIRIVERARVPDGFQPLADIADLHTERIYRIVLERQRPPLRLVEPEFVVPVAAALSEALQRPAALDDVIAGVALRLDLNVSQAKRVRSFVLSLRDSVILIGPDSLAMLSEGLSDTDQLVRTLYERAFSSIHDVLGSIDESVLRALIPTSPNPDRPAGSQAPR